MSARLVFIHGAGCDGSVFVHQTRAFENAVALNLLGHGRPGYAESISAFADDVANELAHNGFDNVILAGSSMGGAIALELALRKHPAVRALALLGSGAKLRVAPAIFEAIDKDFPAAAKMLAGYFFHQPNPAMIDAAVAAMLAVGPAQTHADFAACNAFDVTERVAEIAVPVLALTGEGDVMTPPKMAAFLADRIPGAQARIIPGAGHLLFIERPVETNDALRTFVSQVDH